MSSGTAVPYLHIKQSNFWLGFRPSSLESCPRGVYLHLRATNSGDGGGELRLRASSREVGGQRLSPWDDEPYEVLPSGRKSYIDEQDVVSFLDPPKELIPIDPESYNPAAYLWKKIGNIPEERRFHLLNTVKDRLISRLWEMTGTRYQDSKLAGQSASALLSLEHDSLEIEYWNCQTSQGPLPISWLNVFRKVIFRRHGNIYGRLILGGSFPFGFAKLVKPLYFKVRQVTEVMSTEQPCDLAYEFGTGHWDNLDIPEGFPEQDKHMWPFNDQMVIYIRHAGPGVLVGQAWQEGENMDQVPKKIGGEILMVKDYSSDETR